MRGNILSQTIFVLTMTIAAFGSAFPKTVEAVEKTKQHYSIKYNKHYNAYKNDARVIIISLLQLEDLFVTKESLIKKEKGNIALTGSKVLQKKYVNHFYQSLRTALKSRNDKIAILDSQRIFKNRIKFKDTYYRGIPVTYSVPEMDVNLLLYLKKMVFDINITRTDCGSDVKKNLAVSLEYILWDNEKNTYISFGRYTHTSQFIGYLDEKEMVKSAKILAKYIAKKMFY